MTKFLASLHPPSKLLTLKLVTGEIAISPEFAVFMVGETPPYSAQYIKEGLPPKELYYTWRSSHPSVGYVRNDGTRQAEVLAAGTTVITLDNWQYSGLVSNPALLMAGTLRTWVVDRAAGVVHRYSADGAHLDSWSLVGENSGPQALATDGTYMYVVGGTTRKVYLYHIAGGLVGSWDLHGDNQSPCGMDFDPSLNLHVVDGSGYVFLYTGGGLFQGTWPLTIGNDEPKGIAIDPTGIIWIPDGDGRVYKYMPSKLFHRTFPLDGENSDPRGCFASRCSLWVVDGSGWVFVYALTPVEGELIKKAWQLYAANTDPEGITSNFCGCLPTP